MTDNLDNRFPADEPDAASQAALEKQIAALTEAVDARNAFLAVASHELRNPMTPILAQVQRLNRIAAAGGSSPEIAKGLNRLERLVEHYIRRATALLEVSRMTTGMLRLNPEHFDLAAQVRQVVEVARPSAEHAGSSLSCNIPEECPVFMDRLAIEQILDNLVSNAVKYGAGCPIAVTIAVADEQVILAVRDHGMGISAADQARIFDRFERAVTQGSAIGGFGVGLWVVGQLVHAMGASVHVDSKVGEGTTFTLRLPLRAKGMTPE